MVMNLIGVRGNTNENKDLLVSFFFKNKNKIKMETRPFNIIRELYLNPENRNLLKNLLKYINTRDRGRTIVSLHKEKIELGSSMCLECYKRRKAKSYRCVQGFPRGACKDCYLEHIIKYTKKCKPYIFNRGLMFGDTSKSEVRVRFEHLCGWSILHSANFKLNEKDSLNFLYNGIYKENIIDYINDGYKFDWSVCN